MGITGEFVRSVFSSTRSVGTQENSARSNVVEKRKRYSVRSYLCGDEFNSVLAEEDSASVKSSEATVTQPALEELTDKGDIRSEETKEKHNSMSKLFHEEDAAIIIQSAFRRFLARCRNEVNKSKNSRQKPVSGTVSPGRESVGTSIEVQTGNEEDKSKDSKQEPVSARVSPGRESVGTSIEVQTGNSVDGFSLQEERMAVPHHIHQKARTQIFRIKEDWDDSQVSSNVSKMRIQNRLEASTRRERALAYAFAQQLRICSKKKQIKSDGGELNMGWNWLERWMATRLPLAETSSVENHTSEQLEPLDNNRRFMGMKRFFDAAGEEKESCGSNEVSVQLDSISVTAAKEMDGLKPTRHRLKATRTVSRRKTVPSYQCPKESSKVSKKDCSKETDTDKKNRQKQAGNKEEIKCKDAAS